MDRLLPDQMTFWMRGRSQTALHQALGLTSTPRDGMEPRQIHGVWVRVEPLRGEKPAHGKRHTHRLLATCPHCGVEMSAGRLHQHIDTPTCQRLSSLS